jgi:hypothetical protein
MGIREEVYFEGGPHIGDLITNILIGLTIVGLPLTVGAIVRALSPDFSHWRLDGTCSQ